VYVCDLDSNKKLKDALIEFSGDVALCKQQDEVQDSLSCFNPLMGTLKPQSIGSYTASSMVIGKLAVDGWAVTFDTARRGHPLLASSSRMRVINHNWSATKQRPHPQSVAEISRHSVLSGDRIRQCETSSGSRHKDTDQCL